VIMDSQATKDSRRLSVYRCKMPEYANHAACGVMWKRAVFVVGGEVQGEWSRKAYKFDFEEFGFKVLKEMD
jgi:hypothetical protein